MSKEPTTNSQGLSEECHAMISRISHEVRNPVAVIKGKARNGRFLDKFNGNLLFFEENAGIGTEILEQKIRIHVSAYRPI